MRANDQRMMHLLIYNPQRSHLGSTILYLFVDQVMDDNSFRSACVNLALKIPK
jgi:hypothetical protein